MSFRRLLPSAAVLLLAASSLAQLTREAKEEVLRGVDDVLTREAFVPGVELDNWRTFLDRRSTALERAETPWEFAAVVNGALRECGVSHISLSPYRSSRYRRGGYGAFQQDAPQQTAGRALPLKWLAENAALIRVRSFSHGYRPSEIEEMFDAARSAKYLVLDLRSNPGGEVVRLQHLLGMLLYEGTPVGTFVSRRMAEEYANTGRGKGDDSVAIAQWSNRKFRVTRTGSKPFPGGVAVLVDGRSASAAEIVASALREIKGSLVVGRPTAGAVLMSTFERLPHGFRIQYPISDYVSIKGKRLEGNPLVPDVELSVDEVGSDEAVDIALERLLRRA